MPDVTARSFSNAELLDLLVDAAGVHEGLWVLTFDFGIGQGTFGPPAGGQDPGIAITVARVGIKKVSESNGKTIPQQFVVDAAKVTRGKHQEQR